MSSKSTQLSTEAARGLVNIDDGDSMATIRVDNVTNAVIIEVKNGWIGIDPDDVSNVITSLQMADGYLEGDK